VPKGKSKDRALGYVLFQNTVNIYSEKNSYVGWLIIRQFGNYATELRFELFYVKNSATSENQIEPEFRFFLS
jgi:hypothetical protein